MIGITALAHYIPESYESNFSRLEQFSINEDFINEKLGIEKISRKAEGEETSDLCVKAFHNLQQKCTDSLANIDCLVVCTQNPDGNGIPHTSAVVHGKLGLSDSCACFDISLGCSGYVYALSVIKAFMEAQGLKLGLLFTADPYSEIIDPDDKDTALLFGDAATVTLLQDMPVDKLLWVPKSFIFATRGRGGDALHNRGQYLSMNGRAIFNFVVKQVPLQVNNLLEKESLSASDIDTFLFHQGSKYIVDRLQLIMKLPSDKVPVKLKEHGNTISSSLPLLLEDFHSVEGGEKIIMSGFGVGLSWATCLIVHGENKK